MVKFLLGLVECLIEDVHTEKFWKRLVVWSGASFLSGKILRFHNYYEIVLQILRIVKK